MKAKLKKIGTWFKTHKKLRTLIIVLIILGVIAIWAVSCVNKAKAALEGLADSSSEEVITERDIKNTISATGKIISKESRTYSSTVVNTDIVSLNVAIGDKVQAGDVLCVLDSSDLEQNLADANVSRNAAAGTSGISVNAANRSLNNAVEVRDIDQKRANQKIADAQADYNDAQNEANEAKKKYEDADDDYDDAKDDASHAKDELKEAQRKAGAYNTEMANSQATFENAKSALGSAIDSSYSQLQSDYQAAIDAGDTTTATTIQTEMGNYHLDKLGLISMGSVTSGNVSASDVYSGSEAIKNTVDSQFAVLKKADDDYAIAAAANTAANDALSSAQSKYSSALAAEEAAKAKKESLDSTYKSLQKAADTAGDMITSAKQSKEDVTRNDNLSVASSSDSVKSANISASTATLSSDSTIRTIEEQIDDCTVRSGINGIVTNVAVQQGDRYAGGAIVTIEDNSSYEIETQIDEYDISKVAVGQKVTIKTNATGDDVLEGEIATIAPRATAQASTSTATTVNYRVTIKVLTPNDALRLDMTARLNIILEERENALSVSNEAVQTDEDGNFFVEVIDEGTTMSMEEILTNPEKAQQYSDNAKEKVELVTHNVYVTKGLEGDYYVEIIGEGLKAGDRVVVPVDGSIEDIAAYMEEAGAAGGM